MDKWQNKEINEEKKQLILTEKFQITYVDTLQYKKWSLIPSTCKGILGFVAYFQRIEKKEGKVTGLLWRILANAPLPRW